MRMLFLVALGGAAGAASRYTVSNVAHRILGGSFPWGTLTVNLAGCFLIGFLWGVSEEFLVPPDIRTLVFTGFLGAFTTFSTYSFETFGLLRDGEYKLALWNVLFSNLMGLFLVIFGFFLAKYLIQGMRR